MNTNIQNSAQSSVLNGRMLHTMIRVKDIERSLAFYIKALGMRELRREDYPKGHFTLVFVGYGEEDSNTVIELTHNWGENNYQQGTGFGHIAIGVRGIYRICESLASMQVNIIRQPGPMSFTSDKGNHDVIAFVEDPDGYRIELVDVP